MPIISSDSFSRVAVQPTASTALTRPFTVAAGANAILLVCLSANKFDFSYVTGITYGGVALTQAMVSSDGVQPKVGIWYLLSPAVGTANVVVNSSINTSAGAYSIIHATGVAQSPPPTGSAEQFVSSAFISPTVTVAAGDVAVLVASALSGGTHSVASGSTALGTLALLDGNGGSGAGSFAFANGAAPRVNFSATNQVAGATIVLKSDAADTTPPIITGPGNSTGSTSTVTINENTTSVFTFSASESVTWSISGGADAARFSIGSANGLLAFLTAPDFEVPTDANGDNVYIVVVRATDGAGNQTNQTVTVQVANVAESDITAPTLTGAISVVSTSQTSIQISHPAGADNSGSVAYRYSNDGGATYPGTSLTPGYTFTGLTAGTAYPIRVVAADASGNISTPPLALTVSTAAALGTATITVPRLMNWSNSSPLTNTVIPNVMVVRRSDRTVLLSLANQPTNASGDLVIASALLTVGVGCQVFGFNADGSESGSWPATPV